MKLQLKCALIGKSYLLHTIQNKKLKFGPILTTLTWDCGLLVLRLREVCYFWLIKWNSFHKYLKKWPKNKVEFLSNNKIYQVEEWIQAVSSNLSFQCKIAEQHSFSETDRNWKHFSKFLENFLFHYEVLKKCRHGPVGRGI